MTGLPRKAIGIIRAAVGQDPVGRNLSKSAKIEKGIIVTKKGGAAGFDWEVVKDPEHPRIAREKYSLDISPVMRGGDLVGLNMESTVDAIDIPKPLSSKIIRAMDNTKNSCTVGFLAGNKMNVSCSYSEKVPPGRFEDWIFEKQPMVRKANSVVSRARSKIYNNFV